MAVPTTQEIASYMTSRFIAELTGSVEKLQMPRFPLDLLEECNFATKLLVRAVRNKKVMTWSVVDYLAELGRRNKRCRGTNERLEREMLRLFPPPESDSELISAPCVVVDSEGRILLWYLPGLMGLRRQGLIWDSLAILESKLVIKKQSTNWRDNPKYFHKQEYQYKPGTVSFALAWYQQGHVGHLDLEVGAELRNAAGLAWVQSMERTTAFLGAVLAVAHPATFQTGMDCVKAIGRGKNVQKTENLEDLMGVWSSPFTTTSLMSNRDTPLHRDVGGAPTYMDLLVSVGTYKSGEFHVPGLGLRLWYRPGTVVGLLGRVVRHGAVAFGGRLCFAQYLRESVVEVLQIPAPDWVYIQDLLQTH